MADASVVATDVAAVGLEVVDQCPAAGDAAAAGLAAATRWRAARPNGAARATANARRAPRADVPALTRRASRRARGRLAAGAGGSVAAAGGRAARAASDPASTTGALQVDTEIRCAGQAGQARGVGKTMAAFIASGAPGSTIAANRRVIRTATCSNTAGDDQRDRANEYIPPPHSSSLQAAPADWQSLAQRRQLSRLRHGRHGDLGVHTRK